jgi:glycosyltransferase involved in cell wall biosynthesis
MNLSVVVITRNEEACIEECLKSVRWAREIVVVDAMSTDRTCEIARKYTPKVFSKPWEGYAPARRYAMSLARSEWVLSVDADEIVTPELRGEIETTLAGESGDGYLIPRKAFFLGRWISHCGWYPGYVLRLFRKEKAAVTPRMVHEGIRVQGRVGRLKNHILHYTYPTVGSYITRFSTYTSLSAQELYAEGKRFHLVDIVGRPGFQFIKMFFLKRGFLDGFPGFALCVLSGFHVFVKYLKLWEIEHRGHDRNNEGQRRNIR